MTSINALRIAPKAVGENVVNDVLTRPRPWINPTWSIIRDHAPSSSFFEKSCNLITHLLLSIHSWALRHFYFSWTSAPWFFLLKSLKTTS